MTFNLVYLYLLAPLHTGGTSQEGNLVGIARESHTDLPYVPSSTIRGRQRAATNPTERIKLWGNTIDDLKSNDDSSVNLADLPPPAADTSAKITNLIQGALWVGDASILWMPVPSLSHGVIWVSCPLLLQRWGRLSGHLTSVPQYSTNLGNSKPVYLKDAILKASDLRAWKETDWHPFIPEARRSDIQRLLVLPDQHCATLIQMSLWRQVKVRLDEHKTVKDGFRYEEAIPPDTLMYFPWGTTQANKTAQEASDSFGALIQANPIAQIGGQESLGRGFVQQWDNGSANGGRQA
ncbi:MAG: type III-B CRISPR module RAMP protein Cmr4 [Elainella sp.]